MQSVRFEGKTLDRLTAIGMLARMDDRDERHRLFLAIDTIWRSMNGDDGIAQSVPAVREAQRRAVAHGTALRWMRRRACCASIRPHMEKWLVSVLEEWRVSTPATMIEPWDWHYQAGAASRALSDRIPLDDLGVLNARYFRDLGADVAALHVHYDLTPRVGKTPVAFTDFGGRPHLVQTACGSRASRGCSRRIAWAASTTWTSCCTRAGTPCTLRRSISVRRFWTGPTTMRSPRDSGDVAALEVYEPRWQMHYLGDSVPTALGLRGRYGGIVLDIAWSLFEVRMHRDPGADPNTVWGDITSHYLHITPHPELSWWAMRGQLIDAAGIHGELRDRLDHHRGHSRTRAPAARRFHDGRSDVVRVHDGPHLPLRAVTIVGGCDHGFSGAPDQRDRDSRGHAANEGRAYEENCGAADRTNGR